MLFHNHRQIYISTIWPQDVQLIITCIRNSTLVCSTCVCICICVCVYTCVCIIPLYLTICQLVGSCRYSYSCLRDWHNWESSSARSKRARRSSAGNKTGERGSGERKYGWKRGDCCVWLAAEPVLPLFEKKNFVLRGKSAKLRWRRKQKGK